MPSEDPPNPIVQALDDADAPERTTMFVATVQWDADSEYQDVKEIDDVLREAGYETRMASNNSQLLVMREETDG